MNSFACTHLFISPIFPHNKFLLPKCYSERVLQIKTLPTVCATVLFLPTHALDKIKGIVFPVI
jgi:hypothetical protein